MPCLPLTHVFADLPDPRRDMRNKLHELNDILVLATCAILSDAEGREAIAEYGRTKESFFRRFLRLANGIPSPDTFERVFAKLDPAAFAVAFGNWMTAACEATGLIPIAIDGKSARSAKRGTATGSLHVVTAWAAESRLVLGTVSVADGLNEVAAIPIDPDAYRDLRGAYDFIRTVEGRLRIVHNRAAVDWPDGPDELARLARRLNYEPQATPDAVAAFRADASRFTTRTRSLFEQYVGRPSIG